MTKINQLSNLLVDHLMRPFQLASPWPGLVVVSGLIAVLVLLVFKYCSDQRMLQRRRDRVLARLLELQLFKDDLGGIFGTFGRLLLGILQYVKESLKPLAVLVLPMGLLLIQLAGWFQFRGLKVQEAAVVTVKVDDQIAMENLSVDLKACPEIAVETERFVSTDDHEVLWRIRPRACNPQGWVEVTIDGRTLRKTVCCTTDRLAQVSPARVRDGWWERLNHPAEPPLPPHVPVRTIRVDYPRRTIHVGHHSVNWVFALFALSLGWGLALKSPLRVAV